MTEAQAKQARREIEAVLQKHSCYYSLTLHNKPGLVLIKFEDIAIKIEKSNKR